LIDEQKLSIYEHGSSADEHILIARELAAIER